MSADLLVRGARVVDGSGLAAYTADVEVRDGRITQVGKLEQSDDIRTIDADGLTLTPGFVDIHTHYDAQLYFEPTASPSSWHGVTTVVVGNCGFTFAPATPDDLSWLLLMLSKVEGMSPDALAVGVEYAGGSFADFLASLDGRISVNMAAYAGHASIRRSVMGDAASLREANADEITAMQGLVRDAMRAGAFGFSSSHLDVHADHEGRPVPPNLAGRDELIALASVLGEFPEGVLQFAAQSSSYGYSDEDQEMLVAMARASGGKAFNVNIIMQQLGSTRSYWRHNLDFLERAASDGLRLYPMASVNTKGLHFTFRDTFVFDEMATMRAMMGLSHEEKKAVLRDPAARDQYRREFADTTGRALLYTWEVTSIAAVRDPAHNEYVGRHVSEIAASLGVDPMDFAIDLALAEELETVFVIDRPQQDTDVLSLVLNHPLSMPGSSDGGAHLTSFCGADYPTVLLTECVERGDITFERAVAKLTQQPALAHGMWDRGVIRPGAVGDLVLFDPERLAVGPIRFTNDFPAGASRLVWEQEGYVATIVAGEIIVSDGKPTDARPGEVLRFNQS